MSKRHRAGPRLTAAALFFVVMLGIAGNVAATAHAGAMNHHPVSTQVAAAQMAFDEGMMLRYAYNDVAAQEAFERAARLDPHLTMAYWGKDATQPLARSRLRLAFLDARMEATQSFKDAAITQVRAAISIENSIETTELLPFFVPMREASGEALLAPGRPAEAVVAFEEIFPERSTICARSQASPGRGRP